MLITSGLLALAVASISHTLARGKVFEPSREWVWLKSERLGELVGCPYCTSHWVSFLLVAIYHPILVDSGLRIIDHFISAMVLVMLAAAISKLVFTNESPEVEKLRALVEQSREVISRLLEKEVE